MIVPALSLARRVGMGTSVTLVPCFLPVPIDSPRYSDGLSVFAGG